MTIFGVINLFHMVEYFVTGMISYRTITLVANEQYKTESGKSVSADWENAEHPEYLAISSSILY